MYSEQELCRIVRVMLKSIHMFICLPAQYSRVLTAYWTVGVFSSAPSGLHFSSAASVLTAGGRVWTSKYTQEMGGSLEAGTEGKGQ